jgi:hypothetical protein
LDTTRSTGEGVIGQVINGVRKHHLFKPRHDQWQLMKDQNRPRQCH